MSLNKRVKGNFVIETIDLTDTITLRSDGGITIDGNLTVLGDSTQVESTNTTIVDNIIVLNSGEPNDGVSEGTAGIEIDRGGWPDVGIRYNETGTKWEATDDGTTWYALDAIGVGGGMNDLIDDTTPQLGGNLDVNGKTITSASDGDIILIADGAGLIKIDQDLSLKEQATDETPTAGYNKLYAKVAGGGGSGLYVANSTTVDELVSRRKAIVYSIIF